MRKITLLLLIIFTIFIAGCGDSNSKYATQIEDITGIWRTVPAGSAMEIQPDGSYHWALTSADVKNGKTTPGGTFHFEGDKVIATGLDFGSCTSDTRGEYKIEFLESGNIKFELIEDPCVTRVPHLAGQQVEPKMEHEWEPVS